MTKIETKRPNTLHLVLTRKWFDKILSGEKKFEYRKGTLYWIKRFNKIRFLEIDNITFYHGYARDRESFKIQLKQIEIIRATNDGSNEELDFTGMKDTDYFYKLHLGEIISNSPQPPSHTEG